MKYKMLKTNLGTGPLLGTPQADPGWSPVAVLEPEQVVVSTPTLQRRVPTFQPWPASTVILILSLMSVVGLFWDTFVSLVSTWSRSENYEHGFLILPVALYVIWTRRDEIALLKPVSGWWGLPILALLGSGWLLGHVTNVLVVQQFAVVTMLQVLVWTIL